MLLTAEHGAGAETQRWPHQLMTQVLCSKTQGTQVLSVIPDPGLLGPRSLRPLPGPGACRPGWLCGAWDSVHFLGPLRPGLGARHFDVVPASCPASGLPPPLPVSLLLFSTAAVIPTSSRFCVPAQGSAFRGAGTQGSEAAPEGTRAPACSPGRRTGPSFTVAHGKAASRQRVQL